MSADFTSQKKKIPINIEYWVITHDAINCGAEFVLLALVKLAGLPPVCIDQPAVRFCPYCGAENPIFSQRVKDGD